MKHVINEETISYKCNGKTFEVIKCTLFEKGYDCNDLCMSMSPRSEGVKNCALLNNNINHMQNGMI